MIIGNIRKEEKAKRKFLDYLKELGIDKKVLNYIKKKIRGENILETIFFNIYGLDDQSRIINGQSELRDLLKNKKFEKIDKIFINFSDISGLGHRNKDLRIDIYIPDFDAGPACQNWLENQN